MKYQVIDNINSLSYFNIIFKYSDEIEIIGNIEIESFQKFDSDFGCIYWFFQYELLKNGKVIIESSEIKDEYKDFFSATEINIIWIHIKDNSNYEIKCIDGIWYIDIFNDKIFSILQANEKWKLIEANVPN